MFDWEITENLNCFFLIDSIFFSEIQPRLKFNRKEHESGLNLAPKNHLNYELLELWVSTKFSIDLYVKIKSNLMKENPHMDRGSWKLWFDIWSVRFGI